MTAADIRAVRPPTTADIAAARQAIAEHLPPTPLLRPAPGGPDLWLKLESFQPTGAFKLRGAVNAMLKLPREKHVIVASSGNFAVAVGYLARRWGRRATAVVPINASNAKIDALDDRVLDIVRAGHSYDEAEAVAIERAGAEGLHFLSGYNDTDVIAGYGTIAPEIEEQLAGLTTLVVSIGGGALCASTSLWAADRPNLRVVGVEVDSSTAISHEVATGERLEVEAVPTLADGVAGGIERGCVNVAMIRRHTHSLVTVSEQEIEHALRFLAAEHGIVAEGSGALGVAAVLAGKVPVAGHAATVITGRRIELGRLAEVFARAPDRSAAHEPPSVHA